MSGGVDSSTVAAMLAYAGHDLIGISMRLYAEERAGRSCCSPDDLLDAREVAEAAGFPFYVANLQTEFEERVVRHFVDEYRRGRTPSPCVLCNDHLKFDALFARVDALGAKPAVSARLTWTIASRSCGVSIGRVTSRISSRDCRAISSPGSAFRSAAC